MLWPYGVSNCRGGERDSEDLERPLSSVKDKELKGALSIDQKTSSSYS